MTVKPSYTISGIGALSTLIVGSGAVGFFLRYSTRLAMLESSQADLVKANLHGRLTALQQIIGELKASRSKLSLLDSVNARREMLLGEIRHLRAGLVPRSERSPLKVYRRKVRNLGRENSGTPASQEALARAKFDLAS